MACVVESVHKRNKNAAQRPKDVNNAARNHLFIRREGTEHMTKYGCASLVCTLQRITKKLVVFSYYTWWRHQIETFSALLALCEGNSPGTGEFPSQRPVTRGFDAFFALCLNKRLSKQSRRLWFETPLRSIWRHCNVCRDFSRNRISYSMILLTSENVIEIIYSRRTKNVFVSNIVPDNSLTQIGVKAFSDTLRYIINKLFVYGNLRIHYLWVFPSIFPIYRTCTAHGKVLPMGNKSVLLSINYCVMIYFSFIRISRSDNRGHEIG